MVLIFHFIINGRQIHINAILDNFKTLSNFYFFLQINKINLEILDFFYFNTYSKRLLDQPYFGNIIHLLIFTFSALIHISFITIIRFVSQILPLILKLSNKQQNFTKYKQIIFSIVIHLILFINSMNEYSWQQSENTNNKNKTKQKKQQNYNDDFQQQQKTFKNYKNQTGLPKIQSNTFKKSPDKSKHINSAVGDQYDYQNDFQQVSQKKLKEKQNIKDKVKKGKNLQSRGSLQTQDVRKSFGSSPNNIKNNQSAKQNKKSPNKQLNIISQGKSNYNKNIGNMQKNVSSTFESKYTNYLKTQFPHTKQQITSLPLQKVSRLNQKLKLYIQKVNDELTDLINQNMRKLKATTLKPVTQTKNVEDQIKLLIQQKKNGETLLQAFEKQKTKLIHKQGSLRQQEFQIIADQQIANTRQKMKQITKEIYDLKLIMKNQGNKLTQNNNYSQKSTQVKGKLLIAKRQEQKNLEKMSKCQNNLDQLTRKNQQIQNQFQKILQMAKRQNIKIPSGHQGKKKSQKLQQLKKKLQNLKLHKQKSATLTQTKVNILKRDNQIQRTQIQQIQKRLSQIQTQIEFTQQSSKAIIQEAKTKDLQPYIQAHLDFVYKNITQGTQFSKSKAKFIHSSKQKPIPQITTKFGLKKYSSVTNAQLYARSQSQAQIKPSFHITKKTPLTLKAKQKNVLKLSEKTSQRVWKQTQPQSNNNQSQQNIIQKQANSSKGQHHTNSKPSLLKKPVVTNIQQKQQKKTQINKNQEQNLLKNIQSKQSEKQNQKSNLLGPKMKFKKQEDNFDKNNITITQKDSNEMKPVQKKAQNEHIDSKPQFKIKKAVKQKVQIPQEDLYLFPNPKTQKLIDGKQKVLKQDHKQDIKIQQKLPVKIELKRGPNFKINKNISQPNISQQLPSETNNKSVLKQPQSVETNIQQQVKIQEQRINFGGRRQVQRKIQRKNEQSYV